MGFFEDVFGDKVKAPSFKEIDIDKEIQDNIQSVLDNVDKAGEASRELGMTQAEATLAVLERFMPGSRALISQAQARVAEGLRGEVPEDIAQRLSDRANANALASGYGFDSGRGRNLALRDLGLASLSRIDTAIQQSQQLLQTVQGLMGPIPYASNFFLTPQQRISFRQSERNAKYQADLTRNTLRAAADPTMQAFGKIGMNMISTATGSWVAGLGGESGAGAGGMSPGGFLQNVGSMFSSGSGIGTASSAAPVGTAPGWGVSMYSPASAALGAGGSAGGAAAGGASSSMFGLASLAAL